MAKLITNGQRFNKCSQRIQCSQKIDSMSSGSFQLADNLEMLRGQSSYSMFFICYGFDVEFPLRAHVLKL